MQYDEREPEVNGVEVLKVVMKLEFFNQIKTKLLLDYGQFHLISTHKTS